jgi:hypothetical protein
LTQHHRRKGTAEQYDRAIAASSQQSIITPLLNSTIPNPSRNPTASDRDAEPNLQTHVSRLTFPLSSIPILTKQATPSLPLPAYPCYLNGANRRAVHVHLAPRIQFIFGTDKDRFDVTSVEIGQVSTDTMHASSWCSRRSTSTHRALLLLLEVCCRECTCFDDQECRWVETCCPTRRSLFSRSSFFCLLIPTLPDPRSRVASLSMAVSTRLQVNTAAAHNNLTPEEYSERFFVWGQDMCTCLRELRG